jgi:hypothetical protein
MPMLIDRHQLGSRLVGLQRREDAEPACRPVNES